MINDTVDILDAKIVNIGIRFKLLGSPEINKYDKYFYRLSMA